MKKLIFVLVLVGLLSVVQGSQDVVELGPYDVSFDLGDLNYTTEFEAPIEGETYFGTNYTGYSVDIIAANGTISIIGISLSERAGLLFRLSYDDEDDELYIRTLDNREVVLAVGETSDGKLFGTTYMLESDSWVDNDGRFSANRVSDKDAYQNGSNVITITSTMDWEATRKLLNTIHVELRDES